MYCWSWVVDSNAGFTVQYNLRQHFVGIMFHNKQRWRGFPPIEPRMHRQHNHSIQPLEVCKTRRKQPPHIYSQMVSTLIQEKQHQMGTTSTSHYPMCIHPFFSLSLFTGGGILLPVLWILFNYAFIWNLTLWFPFKNLEFLPLCWCLNQHLTCSSLPQPKLEK